MSHSARPRPNEDVCMVGLVIVRARHTAKIRAKSLIISEKNYCNHRALMQWNGSFWPKFYLPASLTDRILKTKACCSILLKESNYRPYRVCDGLYCWYVLKLWLCKLSFLKRHPSNQKSKILNHRALLQWKEKNSFRWVHPGSLIGLIEEQECSQIPD
jgi:hypothetical protein